MTSSTSDFLVEKQLQKYQTPVTFPFLLNRSLGWSPLRQERKVRRSFSHLAGKATCLLRGGVTMSTQPPMVSPTLGGILHQLPGFCLFGGACFLPAALTSWCLDFFFRNLPESLLSPQCWVEGRGLSLDWEGYPSRSGSSWDPQNLGIFVAPNLVG